MRNLFNRCLPLYITLWPTTLILAIWSAPVRYRRYCYNRNEVKITYHKRHDTYLQALRITLRSGGSYDNIIRVIKKGVV
jgi:hypothetical protein